MKPKTFKIKKKQSSYFFKSMLTLILLTGLACSDDSSEELKLNNSEAITDEIQPTTANKSASPRKVWFINDFSDRRIEITHDKKNVYTKKFTGSDIQVWRIYDIKNSDYVEIRNKFTHKNMMVDGNNVVVGVSNPNKDDHKWKLVYSQKCVGKLSGTCVKLKHKVTGKYATVTENKDGASVVLRTNWWKNKKKQLWKIEDKK